ncbi:GIY-YIG nuclease family protein [Candidatus Omnitrophota bacterium]
MHYVYVLQSEKEKAKIYVGNTGELDRRLAQHNYGKVYATKQYRPYRIVYYEAYLDRHDALDRELKLKHHGSVIGHLKRRIKRSLAH